MYSAKEIKQIKDSFLLLCNVINKMFDLHFLSSHFTHAKFDRNEENCVAMFWTLIHCLAGCSKKDCPGIVYCVKTAYLRFGYQSLSFYGLPNNKSRGSQVLLLAFTWLLSKSQIEAHLDRRLRKSGAFKQFPSSLIDFEREERELESPPTFDSTPDHLRYMMFYAGKLKNQIRTIEELCETRDKLAQKIRDEVSSSASRLEELTPLEIHLLSEKNESYSKYLEEVKGMSALLEAYLLWTKKSHVFFAWMATVLEKRRDQKPEIEIITSTVDSVKEFISSPTLLNPSEEEQTSVMEKYFSPMSESRVTSSTITQKHLKEEISRMEISIKKTGFFVANSKF